MFKNNRLLVGAVLLLGIFTVPAMVSAQSEAVVKSAYVKASPEKFVFTQIKDPSGSYTNSVIRMVDAEMGKVCYMRESYYGIAISCIQR